jgi:hypothetical protein
MSSSSSGGSAVARVPAAGEVRLLCLLRRLQVGQQLRPALRQAVRRAGRVAAR